MNTLKKVLAAGINSFTRKGIFDLAGCDSDTEAKKFFKVEVYKCSDIRFLQELNIMTDGFDLFFSIEDRLVELMGSDEYFEWADENLD